ncbi:S-adenosyl-L-methionine-dependent tRNA 4-demethylwyosine synthase [Actinomortierella ambigua]|uniref:S-adenosyl-L-methionine-dependent tRNA 4-demethylwyosine synthase n=1 Tax=Actinomortierella ambigua TaxID=1343610 RepID=A0A9P6QHB7_9FUNG|nr:S-adenosyl-L-methionine-dependent tRNA 4-demethylwyosine synthase [Actinomortierella ambigua]
MSSSSSALKLWKEYRIPLVCMALGIATLSILYNQAKAVEGKDDKDDQGQGQDQGKQPNPKEVNRLAHEMEEDPAIPTLSEEARERVVEHAAEEQAAIHHQQERPRQHMGLKKEEFRKLPKVIRKRPKNKKKVTDEFGNEVATDLAAPSSSSSTTATATTTTTTKKRSGCCGGKNKSADGKCCGGGGKKDGGCCSGKNKHKHEHGDEAEDKADEEEEGHHHSHSDGEGCGSVEDIESVGAGCSCKPKKSGGASSVFDPLLLPELQQPIKVFFSTITGTARLFARQFSEAAVERGLPEPKLIDIVDYDTEDFLSETSLCVFILSTYNVEGPNDWFLKWLEDTRFDWRVQKGALAKLKFAVFGLGDSAYGEVDFCNGPRLADKWLGQLGGQRVWPFGEGDKNADQGGAYKMWNDALLVSLLDPSQSHAHEAYYSSDDENGPSASEHDDDDDDDDDNETKEDKETKLGLPTIDGADGGAGSEGEMVDVEDMGSMAIKIKLAKEEKALDEEAYANRKVRAKRAIGESKDGKALKPREVREMVSPLLYKSLTKQGYKIIGSHSGVKICRWTKSALRGRGFCYKRSFYGIQSHLCMETTPSLACANKCVFCWRHHTNPVGTEWRWKVDDPEFILDGALDNHYGMLKQLKGVPGVRADRFMEAQQVKHCALSLVGEPIFYPHINEFVSLLHKKRISSFLVTNAQFPDAITNMGPVTQLYVSVDASTKESLKKIDRPLFRDFWERFLDCLDALSKKGQRTVYRLTLVKDFNTDEIANYVELIRRGKPDFIEVKGVTYCGYGGASGLTMANVPYHTEVVRFVELIKEQLGEGYEIAAEHAHSCSILVANTKFRKDGKWYTHIDYDRFFDLIESGQPFTSLDYMKETPSWAVFGAPEGGFDPEETRFFRKTKEQRKAAREREEQE